MPNPGQVQRNTRTGETRQWDGQGWQSAASTPTSPTPSTSDSRAEPDTWLGGFSRHLLEKEPAARNALLGGAALLTGGTAPIVAAPLVGRGTEYLSKFLTGENPLPESGTQLATDLGTDVATGLGEAFGGRVLSKGAQLVRQGKDALTKGLPLWVSKLGHASALGSAVAHPGPLIADLATSKPATDFYQAVGNAATPGSGALRNVLTGLKPGLNDSAAVVAPRVRPPSQAPFRVEDIQRTPEGLRRQLDELNFAEPRLTTGHFKEGSGGLSDVAAGKIKPEPWISDWQAGDPNIPGLSIGKIHPPLPDFAVPVSKAKQAANALIKQSEMPALNPNVREIPRVDKQWGPGATTKSGLPAQADVKPSNLKYDPQTDTAYIRQQLQEAIDPGDRAYLAAALAQRSKIDRARAASDALLQ